MASPFEGGKSPDFHISKKWHKVYQNLCRRVGTFNALFKKYTNLYTLCAAIGYHLNEKIELDKEKETPFTLEQVDENTEWPVLIAIAWVDAGQDMNIFNNSKEIIRICDQYAEAGMKKIMSMHPFDKIFTKDYELLNPENYEVELNTAFILQELKKDFSLL